MKTSYKELLKRAYSQLPQKALEHRRFEIPKVHSFKIGMRTYIPNFKEIADTLNRDPLHLLKYMAKEMATKGDFDGTRAIFQGKFYDDTLNRIVESYAKTFVMCPICNRPDTKIVKERRLYFLICAACGAKSSISTT